MLNYFYLFGTTLLLSLSFIFLGSLGIIAPWSEGTRTSVLYLLEHSRITLSLTGAALIVVGSSLFVHQLLSLRRRPYFLRTGRHSLAIDQKVLDQTLQSYCKERFPGREVMSQVHIVNRQLAISLNLPRAPKELQRPILTELEHELRDLFLRLFGYRKSIELIATFDE